jgi:hypothetical protein
VSEVYQESVQWAFLVLVVDFFLASSFGGRRHLSRYHGLHDQSAREMALGLLHVALQIQQLMPQPSGGQKCHLQG